MKTYTIHTYPMLGHITKPSSIYNVSGLTLKHGKELFSMACDKYGLDRIIEDGESLSAGGIGYDYRCELFAVETEDEDTERTDSEPTLNEQLTDLWLTWYPQQPPTKEQLTTLRNDAEKLEKYLTIKPNVFLCEDKSGRGFIGKFDTMHMLNNWDRDQLQETDDSDRTLEQFVCTSEFGEVWEIAELRVENIGN